MRLITPDEAREIHANRAPVGLNFAPGYPTPGAREVMDLYVGERTGEVPPGFTPFFMVRKSDGVVIGEIGYTTAEEQMVATAGYGVTPSCEGQGFTTEAMTGLIQHCFALGFGTVRADTTADHIASRRVMEKSGMTFLEQIEREEDGALATIVVYAIDA